MRKILLAALAALLLLPAVAFADREARATKAGTLSVKDGDGMIYINGKGALIGRIDKVQRIILVDVVEDEGSAPSFTGCDGGSGKEKSTEDGDGTYTVCRGAKIKFKLIGGTFRMRINGGTGIDLSVVGQTKADQVQLDGDEDAELDFDYNDGTYSFDGDSYRSLPDKLKKFQLGS